MRRFRLDPSVINKNLKSIPRAESSRPIKRPINKARNSFDRWLIMCDLNHQDAASVLGCSVSMVNQYAQGRRTPKRPMRVMMMVIACGKYGEYEPWPE